MIRTLLNCDTLVLVGFIDIQMVFFVFAGGGAGKHGLLPVLVVRSDSITFMSSLGTYYHYIETEK